MIPGPTIIRKCSSCNKHIAEKTIESGNTFGARFWTDGKRHAPMLPDQPLLVRCPHCSSLVWIGEQEKLGEHSPSLFDDAERFRFPNALPASTPNLDEYLAVLQGGVDDLDKERYLRLCAWWAGNDCRRDEDTSAQLDSLEAANLRALITLLDESDQIDRLIKAEALRELGEFTDAGNLLSMDFDNSLVRVVDFIRKLNEMKVAKVTEVKFD